MHRVVEDYRRERSEVEETRIKGRRRKTKWKDPSAGASAATSQDDPSAGQNRADSCIKQQLFCPAAAGFGCMFSMFPCSGSSKSGQSQEDSCQRVTGLKKPTKMSHEQIKGNLCSFFIICRTETCVWVYSDLPPPGGQSGIVHSSVFSSASFMRLCYCCGSEKRNYWCSIEDGWTEENSILSP